MDFHSPTSKKRSYTDLIKMRSPKVFKFDEVFKENYTPDILCNSYIKRNSELSDVSNLNTVKATPKKHLQSKEDPITPNSNIKLLTTLAAERDYVTCNTPKSVKLEKRIVVGDNNYVPDMDAEQFKPSRKEKSLALICTKFLEMYPLHPDPTTETVISLDDASQKLKVERRRLYDIVNVFESIDMLTKIAKNQYIWYGKNNLLYSLKLLKEAAVEECIEKKLEYVLKAEDCNEHIKQSCILDDVQFFNKSLEFEDESVIKDLKLDSSPLSDVRKEKSLALMSQKFLMLFLVSSSKVISLGVAAKVLNGFQKNNKGAQIKTQIRRLYDIANVLSSVELVEKALTQGISRKKPAYKYIGPDLKDYKENNIVPINRSRFSLNKSIKPRSLIRHSSFQEICAVAEVEHQKLVNIDDAPKSAPPFHKSLLEQCYGKTNFTDWNCDEKNSDSVSPISSYNFKPIEDSIPHLHHTRKNCLPKPTSLNKSVLVSLPVPKTVPQGQKVTNMPKLFSKDGSFYLLNNVNSNIVVPSNLGGHMYVLSEYVPMKQAKESEGTSNDVSKTIDNIQIDDVRKEPEEKPITSKTIELSSEQREAILRSLNISLSEGQVAAIQFTGNSCTLNLNSNSQCNMGKVMENSSKPEKLRTSNSSPSTESNGLPSSSSSSVVRSVSPLSIPSGYATPTLGASSDITSFPSTSEVDYILKKIENGTDSRDSTQVAAEVPKQLEFKLVKEMRSKHSIRDCPTNDPQVQNLDHLTDNCSNESFNAEVSNILKETPLGTVGGASARSHSFLIDEKTILSPLKKPQETAKAFSSSPSITPPRIVTQSSVFLLNPLIKYHKSIPHSICNTVRDAKQRSSRLH